MDLIYLLALASAIASSARLLPVRFAPLTAGAWYIERVGVCEWVNYGDFWSFNKLLVGLMFTHADYHLKYIHAAGLPVQLQSDTYRLLQRPVGGIHAVSLSFGVKKGGQQLYWDDAALENSVRRHTFSSLQCLAATPSPRRRTARHPLYVARSKRDTCVTAVG